MWHGYSPTGPYASQAGAYMGTPAQTSAALMQIGRAARHGHHVGQGAAALNGDYSPPGGYCPPGGNPLADLLLKTQINKGSMTGMENPLQVLMCGPGPYGMSPASGCHRWPLDFVRDAANGGQIPAGATVAVVAFPQVPGYGERLIVPSTIADNFRVQITVGKSPQTLQIGAGTAARIYTEQSIDVMVMTQPFYPGMQVTMAVQNRTNDALDFEATLICRALS